MTRRRNQMFPSLVCILLFQTAAVGAQDRTCLRSQTSKSARIVLRMDKSHHECVCLFSSHSAYLNAKVKKPWSALFYLKDAVVIQDIHSSGANLYKRATQQTWLWDNAGFQVCSSWCRLRGLSSLWTSVWTYSNPVSEDKAANSSKLYQHTQKI